MPRTLVVRVLCACAVSRPKTSHLVYGMRRSRGTAAVGIVTHAIVRRQRIALIFVPRHKWNTVRALDRSQADVRFPTAATTVVVYFSSYPFVRFSNLLLPAPVYRSRNYTYYSPFVRTTTNVRRGSECSKRHIDIRTPTRHDTPEVYLEIVRFVGWHVYVQ